MDAVLIGIGEGGAEDEATKLEHLWTRMQQKIEQLRFFIADGASVNAGDKNGIPEVLMRRHPNLLLIFVWCLAHVLNLCLICFAKVIAANDTDIYQRTTTITSYLRLNKANFVDVLKAVGAATHTLIQKG